MTDRDGDRLEWGDFKFLGKHETLMIDEALKSVGEHGEVHLVVAKGKLRFLSIEVSHDVLKWQPGEPL
ncbi:MAG: hypothetical protein P1P76_10710 [Anaerolineales bacterium]|nr:hypothetical protein [Anaerolineales bacterium]